MDTSLEWIWFGGQRQMRDRKSCCRSFKSFGSCGGWTSSTGNVPYWVIVLCECDIYLGMQIL